MAIDFLQVKSGRGTGAEMHPQAELVVGRAVSGEGLLAGDPEISQRHARFTRLADGALVVEDLGSTNGTYVNGVRITRPRELHPADVVRVGTTTIEAHGAATDGGGTDASPHATATMAESPSPATTGVARPVEQAGSPSSLRPAAPVPEGPAVAELIDEGRRIPLPPGGVTIGRDDDNDLVIAAPSVSRRHARILSDTGRHYVADLGSANGTELNGERLRDESRWLTTGDTIGIGGRRLRFLAGEPTRFGQVVPAGSPLVVGFEDRRLTVGRHPSNDIVLDDPNVSRFHAEVVQLDAGAELRDLGSRNGTRLDGRDVDKGTLHPGSEIGVGPFRMVFDGAGFVQRDDRGALRLRADEVSVRAGEKTILNRASLSVEPGEFVVVIGESGSGKSTMIKALAGVTEPSSGTVSVNGEPVTSRQTDIGYVPQDDIVHRGLTVRESLGYSARLRLPRDSTDADVAAAVERVLEELSLQDHADTVIGALSGGQRKRAGVATELLSRPSLLFLDEPTTGMDPGLETRMMQLFRELAEAGIRAVMVVTHATKNLALADKVAVMGRGGELTYFGDPAGAVAFFGVADHDGIYTALDERPGVEWRRDFEAGRQQSLAGSGDETGLAQAVGAGGLDGRPGRRGPRRRPRTGPQAGVLAQRYVRLFARDRRNLAILLGQVVVFGLSIALLFRTGVLDGPGRGRPGEAAQLLFLLVITVVWMGLVDGSREIIKERALLGRETSVGVGIGAYLTSKAVVLFPLLAVQTALLLVIVFGIRPAGEPVAHYALLFAILVLAGCASVAVGLLISSVSGSEDQATSFLPLALIPQLLFAGAIVSVDDMGQPVRALANTVFARWAFGGVGGSIDMNERIAGDPAFARLEQFGPSFFDLSAPAALLLQVLFLAVFLGGVALLLRRQRA